jgi:hypothetical protein
VNAAAIVKAAHASGVELALTASGSVKFKGPSEAVARWTPILAANKPSVIEKLSRLEPVHVEDREERAAYLEFDAGLPRAWAEPFARLLCGNSPAGYTAERWQCTVDAALTFADKWAAEAYQLGWTVEDVCGLHPIAPAARNDCKGIAWLLDRARVAAIDANGADIVTEGGARQRFYRKITTPSIDEAKR